MNELRTYNLIHRYLQVNVQIFQSNSTLDKAKLEEKAEELINECKMKDLVFDINYLISIVKKAKTYTESQQYFDYLEEYHSFVSSIFMKHNKRLPSALFDFFKKYERIDDERGRRMIFEMLQSAERK